MTHKNAPTVINGVLIFMLVFVCTALVVWSGHFDNSAMEATIQTSLIGSGLRIFMALGWIFFIIALPVMFVISKILSLANIDASSGFPLVSGLVVVGIYYIALRLTRVIGKSKII